MFDIYTLLTRAFPQPSITTQTGQPDRPCGKKAPLIRIFLNLMTANMFVYVKPMGTLM